MSDYPIGSLVRVRDREWVVLPSPDPNIARLRPLTGSEREVCGIYLPLADLGVDRIEPAEFPRPQPADVADAVGAELLWNAARLTLREGAGPFRSLGRISVRPRAYQFAPLLMALRLDPVRLLIADDVGVGKTIEALLIARELLDRGDARRLCVLCPPYLCDQWQKELWDKFQIEAAVIRSGTVSQLERDLPSGDHSIFGYYQHIVASIDYAKSERHRANFLQHCPDLVVVDEAHGAAQPAQPASQQQQRHQLLRELAADSQRHLLLLTATPHSGMEASFVSLLGLLRPDFARLDLGCLGEKERDELARHFVQRRRGDIAHWPGEETPFPQRESDEQTYDLSPKYKDLFERVYKFSQSLVRTGETLSGWRRRIRYWSALALLRCVMSSPAAAEAALMARARPGGELLDQEAGDDAYAPYIYEPTDEDTVDVQPAHIVEESEAEMGKSEQRKLRQFARLAAELKGKDDHKMARCAEVVADLLRQDYRPIVWCRYIATSDYVAAELEKRLPALLQNQSSASARKPQAPIPNPQSPIPNPYSEIRVLSVTGALPEDERRLRVQELVQSKRYVLVATDCLSEGINLQDDFSAVVHYDLPWNPNRLEQREGRVDRFGQTADKVKAVLIYGRDNPVDGAVLDVLLRKAQEIRAVLGISVPVPMDSETVMEAVLRALFFRGPEPAQLRLFDEPIVTEVQRRWDKAADREKENRTRFAQRAIKSEEVERELRETDSVLGDPEAVQRFVLNACQRLGVNVRPGKEGQWLVANLAQLPDFVRASIPAAGRLAGPAADEWRVAFSAPTPPGCAYLGRNHPFVAALAQYLLEAALTQNGNAPAARCGVIKTKSVERRTMLLLLRLRFLIQEPAQTPQLAEEVLVCAFRGFPPDRLEWLGQDEPPAILQAAGADANITPQERAEVLTEVLGWWPDLQGPLEGWIAQRARKLQDAHRRVRAAARLARRGLEVRPHVPPDLLGVLVLLPVPQGGKR